GSATAIRRKRRTRSWTASARGITYMPRRMSSGRTHRLAGGSAGLAVPARRVPTFETQSVLPGRKSLPAARVPGRNPGPFGLGHTTCSFFPGMDSGILITRRGGIDMAQARAVAVPFQARTRRPDLALALALLGRAVKAHRRVQRLRLGL